MRTRTDSGSFFKICGLTRTQKFQDPHISVCFLTDSLILALLPWRLSLLPGMHWRGCRSEVK